MVTPFGVWNVLTDNQKRVVVLSDMALLTKGPGDYFRLNLPKDYP
jgi:hypothetical protein